MKSGFNLVLAALSLSLVVKSQNTSSENPVVPHHSCGTAAPSAEWDSWFNKKVLEYKDRKSSAKTANTSITIPVIVHVIHAGSAVNIYPNISGNQIRSQINVLNKDFAGTGYNSDKLASTGFSVVGAVNTGINFCLAQFDPNGAPLTEPGIDRISYNAMGWTSPTTYTSKADFQNFMDGTVKPNTIWDPTAYFNIWISDVNPLTELLGYATFPAGVVSLSGLTSNIGSSSTDGIWVLAKCFGNVGTPSTLMTPYDQGRTATHETGHWLGLRHIGGDGNGNPSGDCNATDYCDDTPPQKGGNQSGQYGQNFGAPAYPLHAFVCGSPDGDMFMNFMDYSNDASAYMFTPDQNARMQTALSECPLRNGLNNSAAALCIGMPLADFMQDSIACISIAPVNTTYEGTSAPSYSWSVRPANGVVFSPTATSANPNITFPETGSYTITMVASNSLGVSSNTLAVRLEDCTGVKENSLTQNHVRLIPNPSSGQLSIDTDFKPSADLQLSVYNSLGQLILSKHGSSLNADFDVDLGAFPNGVYTVNVSNGKEKVVKRLILAR